MEGALNYEHFVRKAFEVTLQRDVGRGDDPAHLAEAGVFDLNDVAKVKVGTGYAMAACSAHIGNGPHNSGLTEVERRRMDTIIADMLDATTITQIDQYITEYKDKFFPYL